MTDEERKLYTEAIKAWGEPSQWRQAQEECAELIAAINRFDRGRGSLMDLAEEIADVEIMVAQARLMLGDGPVDELKRFKLERLRERLKEHWIKERQKDHANE